MNPTSQDYPIFSATPPSEEFQRALQGQGSSCDIWCEPCGRIWFCYVGHGDYEEGELEKLLQKAEDDSDGYCAVDYTIDFCNLAGKQVVIGCTCNWLRKYEDFIWGHRRQIAEYLRLKIARLAQDAKQEAEVCTLPEMPWAATP